MNTSTKDIQIAQPALRHRQRRVEDRISNARATDPRNLPSPPLRGTAQNQTWLEIAQLALDLPAWMPSGRRPAHTPQQTKKSPSVS